MSFQITLQPGGQQFQARADQSILQAGLDAGLVLPYGCRDGACGACKAEVTAGRVEHGVVSTQALPDHEREAGRALLCQAHPLSDLSIRARAAARAHDIAARQMPCRIKQLEKVASDVMLLRLQLPTRRTFRFLPGQYIDLILEGGRRRSFSIANAPTPGDTHLELHVQYVDGGYFTPRVFSTLKEKDVLRLEGPLGTFGLDHESRAPIVMIAGGTGFAPLKSLIEALRTDGHTQRPISLYWGARRQEGLYMDALARSWQQQHPAFRYVPVLSEQDWPGRTGLVHHAVMADHPDLSGHQVYACGAPEMIDAVREDLSARCGLAPEAFFSDAFTFSADPQN